MEAKQLILRIVESATRDEAKVRGELFVLHAPRLASVLCARICFERDAADVGGFLSAAAKARINGAKDCAEDTVARQHAVVTARPHAQAVTGGAGLARQSKCSRAVPKRFR